jgi:hypothetical protein
MLEFTQHVDKQTLRLVISMTTQIGSLTSDTTLSGTPADNITEAAECRSVCNPTEEGSPARLAAAFKPRSALRGSQGSPSSVVNTYGVGCHIGPALSRSTL